ncbi:MAG TPA: 5'-nucleotidase C-terminal domain-containing protein [Fimbriimonas sp.]
MKRFFLLSFLFVAPHALAGPLTLTLIHTNDLHAHVDPVKVGKGTYGGYARQITLINQLKATKKNPLVLNGGDTFQGTLYFNVYNGLADAAFMNLVGYQAMAVGNHEFDKGPETLASFIKRVRFPLLAANLDVSGDPALKGLIQPHTVFTIENEKVGVIGATPPDLPELSLLGPTVKMKDLYASLNASVAALESEGVDKIVLLSHVGYDVDQQIAAKVKGIDAIVGGHTHTLLGEKLNEDLPAGRGAYPTLVKNPEGTDTLIFQAWEWGKVVGCATLEFDAKGKIVRVPNDKPIPVDETVVEDPTAASLVGALSLPIETMRSDVVATTSVALTRGDGETIMGDVIADAMLAKGKPAGAQLALMNSGGVRSAIDAGPITYGEVIEVQPFNNTLVQLELKGSELLQALEHSVSGDGGHGGRFLQVSKGFHYTFDPSKPVGRRVVRATLEGRPIEPGSTYKVVVNSFTASGGDGFEVLKNASGKRVDTGLLDVDALIDYLKANPSLSPATEGRVVRL